MHYWQEMGKNIYSSNEQRELQGDQHGTPYEMLVINMYC